MKLSRLCLLGLALGALGACGDDNPVAVDVFDSSVRYYNVMPDTTAITVRPLDFVEAHTTAAGLNFRDSSGTYTLTHSGSRRFGVFYGVIGAPGNDPVNSQIKFLDTTFTLNAGTTNTVYFVGFTRTGSTPRVQAFVTEDNPPTPAAAQWQARALNAAVGQGNIDVYVYRGTAIAATPTFANVAFLAPTSYVGFATASDYSVRVCPAGALNTAATCATRVLGAGVAGTTTGPEQDPIAGTNQTGSVFTLAVTPPSVPTTRVSGGGTFFTRVAVDRRPPRTGP